MKSGPQTSRTATSLWLLLDIFVDPGQGRTGLLGKYLLNSLAVHAVMLPPQQDSVRIRLQHHRNEAASVPLYRFYYPHTLLSEPAHDKIR